MRQQLQEGLQEIDQGLKVRGLGSINELEENMEENIKHEHICVRV